MYSQRHPKQTATGTTNMPARSRGTDIDNIEIRHPTPHDAAALWQLVEEIPDLERDTCYAYLLLCSHFAAGSLIAIDNEGPVAFVFGYQTPSQPEVMFLWRVGVHPKLRGQGLAGALVSRFAELPAYRECRFLEATVPASDQATKALFRGLARNRGVSCTQSAGFPSHLFSGSREDEDLYRVGPLRGQSEVARLHKPGCITSVGLQK